MVGILLFIIGLALGLALGGLVGFLRLRDMKSMQAEKNAETERMFQQMRETFNTLSNEALKNSTEQFFTLAEQKLGQQTQLNSKEMDSKKSLIDQTLQSMKGELSKVNEMVSQLEKDRQAKFNVLSNELTKAANETQKLRETTTSLQSALANSKVRGQWGERMAEDVLRLAGFVEGINYQKQTALKDAEGKAGRPDFTFYLPQERVVHMDVKFPLENYLGWLEAKSDQEKQTFLKNFLKDARARVKEAATKAYTNQETLDYVLVFIPNEQVYAFLHEHDRDLLDDAMKQKVILCSPMTLYAILAVIRQAVDNFHLERTAGEILDLLSVFHTQWEKFVEAMDKLGERIYASQQEFEKLATTRRNMLEKPLRKIESLRESEGLQGQPELRVIENTKT